MAYVARKPLTLSGRQYGAGEVVPLEEMKPERRKQMIDQRRVYHVADKPKATPKPAAKKRAPAKKAAKKTTRRKAAPKKRS